MTLDSSLFVHQLRLEFSFLVSSSPLPWVLAQSHLRASLNTIVAPLLLSSSNFLTFILLHGSFINSAWLLLGFLTLEDGLITEGCAEDGVQVTLRALRVCSDAVRGDKCSCYFHGLNEQDILTILGSVCCRVYWCHTDILWESGWTRRASKSGAGNSQRA